MPEKLAYITVEQFDINLSVSYFYKNNKCPRRSLDQDVVLMVQSGLSLLLINQESIEIDIEPELNQ